VTIVQLKERLENLYSQIESMNWLVVLSIGMLKHLELDNFIQMPASAYLEGYQKYPKGNKAPINLLKLGVSMVPNWRKGSRDVK
jgi:hypothetical protein